MELAGTVSIDILKQVVRSSDRHLKVSQISISRMNELALPSIHKPERERSLTQISYLELKFSREGTNSSIPDNVFNMKKILISFWQKQGGQPPPHNPEWNRKAWTSTQRP